MESYKSFSCYQNLSLSELLGIRLQDKIAIVGCGGKTSTMLQLAMENRTSSVLICTTTRIFPPPAQAFDYELSKTKDFANAGITLMTEGVENGKLLPPNESELDHTAKLFDYVFIEADGSKMLPLKGWAAHEPVVPRFCTATIGVATPHPIGEALSEKNTLRLQQFCEITSAKIGDIITPMHIAQMISHPDGMFKKAVGRKILLINHEDNEKSFNYAKKIIDSLPKDFCDELDRANIVCLHPKTKSTVGGYYD